MATASLFPKTFLSFRVPAIKPTFSLQVNPLILVDFSWRKHRLVWLEGYNVEESGASWFDFHRRWLGPPWCYLSEHAPDSLFLLHKNYEKPPSEARMLNTTNILDWSDDLQEQNLYTGVQHGFVQLMHGSLLLSDHSVSNVPGRFL